MKQRVHLLLITVMGSFLVLLFLMLYLSIIYFTVQQVEHQGKGDINQFRQLVLSQPEDRLDYQELAKLYADTKGIDIIIVDKDSYLLADSREEHAVMSKYIDANLSSAKEEEIASSIIRDKKHDTLNIGVGRVLEIRDKTVIVSFIYQITTLNRFSYIFLLFTAMLLALAAALILLLRNYAVRRYQKPITKLLQHTRKAASSHGGYSKISIDSNSEELVQLVKEFNSLIDKYDLLISSDNEKYSKINSLLSHIRTGIMIIDPDNRISLINPRAEELLKIDKGDIFSDNRMNVSSSRYLKEILSETLMVNDDKHTRYITVTIDETMLLDVSIEAMYSKYIPYEHSGALVLLRDVTEIRRLERLKDEFVSNVSHEMRTPLTVINGFVQTLQAWDIISEEDRKKSLTIIELETERLKKLISELLVLSRIEGEMGGNDRILFGILTPIQEIISSFESIAGDKDISIVKQFSVDEDSLLLGREIWFRQIISNLLENAIKYSPVSTEVTISVVNEGDMIHLTVKDEGYGIPEEDIPRIFERFYRVEKSRNSRIAGSGLGLAITKLMVEEFGGTIEVESSLGNGSVFTVIIPGSNEISIK